MVPPGIFLTLSSIALLQVPADVPHREMYWHISSPYKYLIYPFFILAMAIFVYGFYRKYRFWREGQPDSTRFGNWGERIKNVLGETFLQTGVLNARLGGLIHVLIFWSFLILLFATTVLFLETDFRVPIYRGPLYLLITILSDLAGLALFLGLLLGAYRRYLGKDVGLENRLDDAFVLVLLGVSVITGFFIEGIRIAYTVDPWLAWSPIGYLFSLLTTGWGEPAAIVVFQILWWIHFFVVIIFIAILPFSKLSHIFTVPLNILFKSHEPKGSLTRPDIEAMMESEDDDEEFNLGITSVGHLTWKQRLDLDACIVCGRCQQACPAYTNQKPLNPKRVIQDLKTFAHGDQSGKSGNGETEPPAIVGTAIETVAIWECRTCRACMEECPAMIEHLPLIMELRRAEVMMRGQLPAEASQGLVMMERGGNPFGPKETREEWIREAGLPVVAEGEECDALFYIGCATTYDLEKRKIALDVLKIFTQAGVKVGVLGADEVCCGDPARIVGDENLYQMTAKAQLESIKARKFKYLVTLCPHCYNNFKNEYPQFGEQFKIYHHVGLILKFIRDGRLKLPEELQSKITYHDPCYLGRFNDIYTEPREVLNSINGVELVEMKKALHKSHCCGGGGGHYWMDFETGERVNVTRVKLAYETGADTIAVACVYCLQMINDGIKILNLENRIQVKEIAELVAGAMEEDAGEDQ